MKKKKYHTRLRYEPNMGCKTIAIDLLFIIPDNLDDDFDLDLIRRIIKTTAKGYPTDATFTNELQRRLIIEYSFNKRNIGNTNILRFSLTIPKKDLVKDYSIDDAIAFFKNAIFNPLVENNAFDSERFEMEKRTQLINYENSKYSVYANADRIFMKYADPNQLLHKTYEYNLELIKASTPTSIYELYRKVIKDNNYLVYIGGSIDKKSAQDIYERYFKQDKEEFEVELDYYNFFKPHDTEYHEETFEFNQSALFMEYRASNYKKSDLRYLSLIGNILTTSENDLIFNALRIENNLVYSCYTNRLNYNGIFYVEAYLSKENKERAIEVVKEVFESLRDKEFFTKCFNKLKKGIELDLIRALDRKYYTLDKKIDKDLELRNLQDIKDDYDSIDVDKAIAYLDKIKLTNIVFIEGGNDGKN